MFVRDIRFAARLLRKDRATTVAAVLALGLGIGLVSTIYSVLYGSILRELPVPDGHQVVRVSSLHGDFEIAAFEQRAFAELSRAAEQVAELEGIAAWYGSSFNLSSPESQPARYNGAFVSSDLFELLGVEATLGRALHPGDGREGQAPVVLLGHRLYEQRFGSDPTVVGQGLRINGQVATVVGVMPRGFAFPLRQELWLPIPESEVSSEPGEGPRVQVVGKLLPGIRRDDAASSMSHLLAGAPWAQGGIKLSAHISAYTEPHRRSALTLMMGAVLGVLLIACTNVANLLLARSARRSQDVAVRVALGASRSSVARQLLLESLMLALAGGVAGLILAKMGVDLYNRASAGRIEPYWVDVRLDLQVVLFTLLVAVAASLLAGMLPAVGGARTPAAEILKEHGASGGGRRGALSRGLVVAQVAMSCGLLVATGLSIKSLVQLRGADFGFATERVLTAQLQAQTTDYPEAEDVVAFHGRLLNQVSQLPGLEFAALATERPGEAARQRSTLALEDLAAAGSPSVALPAGGSPSEGQVRLGRTIEASTSMVSPDLFSVVGVQPIEGRVFAASDSAEAPAVALVNHSFARLHSPDQSLLGRRLRVADEQDGPWMTIVGVVPDLLEGGVTAAASPGIYVPLEQHPVRFVSLVLKTSAAPMDMVPALRKEVATIDPHLPLFWVMSLEELIAADTWRYSLWGAVFSAFGLVALLLASTGLYGVVSLSASRRTFEYGLRMALGARPWDVASLIVRSGLGQLLVGLVLGLLLAASCVHLLQTLLYRVHPWDPLVFGLVTLTLLAVGALACWLPARRSLQLDPVRALRYD